MNNDNKKNIKLVSELMNFCYNYDATNINLEIKNLYNTVEITLTAYIKNITSNTLNKVNERLSSPRCHEIEEYYWNLSGDDDTDSELILVGMMTDKANIAYDTKTHILKMHFVRKI